MKTAALAPGARRRDRPVICEWTANSHWYSGLFAALAMRFHHRCTISLNQGCRSRALAGALPGRPRDPAMHFLPTDK